MTGMQSASQKRGTRYLGMSPRGGIADPHTGPNRGTRGLFQRRHGWILPGRHVIGVRPTCPCRKPNTTGDKPRIGCNFCRMVELGQLI